MERKMHRAGWAERQMDKAGWVGLAGATVAMRRWQ